MIKRVAEKNILPAYYFNYELITKGSVDPTVRARLFLFEGISRIVAILVE